MAKLTFYPIGNADSTLIELNDGRLILKDYCYRLNCNDGRVDLKEEVHAMLTRSVSSGYKLGLSHFW